MWSLINDRSLASMRAQLNDRRGMATIEVALIAPLMVTIIFGIIELSNVFRIQNKVNTATGLLSSFIAANASVTAPSGTLADLCTGAVLNLSPFPKGTFSADIVSITNDHPSNRVNGSSDSTSVQTYLDWENISSCPTQSPSSMSLSGAYTLANSPQSLLTRSGSPAASPTDLAYSYSAIVVTTSFTYNNVLSFLLGQSITLTGVAVVRPRSRYYHRLHERCGKPCMPFATMMAKTMSALRASMRRLGRRGSVSVLFAVAALPMVICTAVAIDFSRMTAARATLQEAADGASLSGAAAYTAYAQGDAFNAVAQSVALASFCNATRSLPAGFVLVTSSGSSSCGSQAGPVVSAAIAGAAAGTRGIVANSGCSSSNTVVGSATCGFVVTVSASAQMNLIFPGLFGPTKTVSVTSAAMNPFVNISQALSSTLSANAKYANSIWVYPLLLDANGSPAVTSSNPGALPDTSACTGDPTQTSCGSYSMLASTNYQSCPGQTTPPCTVNGTIFGAGGVVQNRAAGSSVITATTPLGVAFASVGGGGYTEPAGTRSSYGYDRPCSYYSTCIPYVAIGDACVWPWHTVYSTVSQVYDPSGAPIYPWSLVTHWFYSSYLLQSMPPSQGLITTQLTTTTNPSTGYPYNLQIVHSTPQVVLGLNVPPVCLTVPLLDYQRYATTYPTSGNSNCSLYIAKDPANLTPNSGYVGSCFSPSNTPGQTYAAVTCQKLAGHSVAFFWSDMGGGASDVHSYGNGNLQITCAAQSQVKLIN